MLDNVAKPYTTPYRPSGCFLFSFSKIKTCSDLDYRELQSSLRRNGECIFPRWLN